MAVSMHDVARLAGVSQRTVSNVVNDYPHVRPETRARVQQAIAMLEYRPNVSARNLRRGRTGQVALAVPELAAPYFAELADLIQRQADQSGVTMLVDQTGGTREHELRVLDAWGSQSIDGLILSPEALTASDLAHSDLPFPVVLLGEKIQDSGILHVSIDNVAAARDITTHLLQRGCRQIAAIGAQLSVTAPGPAMRRMQGYTEALAAAALPVRPELTCATDGWTRQQGYVTARDLVLTHREVDGIFCFNDTLAIGALKAMHDLGIRVPDDVAIAGWDDVQDAAFTIPALTTVAPDKASIARIALSGLLAKINDTPFEDSEIACSYDIVVRGTS